MGFSKFNVAAAVVLVGAVALSGCGSNVTPEDAARAQGLGGQGLGGQGSVGSDLTAGSPIAGPDDGPTVEADTGAGLTESDPGSGTTVDTGGAGGTGGAAGDDGGSGPDRAGGDTPDPAKTTDDNSADGGAKAGDCKGLKNQTGISNSTITLANVTDVSGPIPGLFKGAQDGARAYVAYFNSGSKLCGRSLSLLALDSREDAAADQQGYAEACSKAFAAIGSDSIFDSGGARTAQDCGLPDLRAASFSKERQSCPSCFAMSAFRLGVVATAGFEYYVREHKAATQSAAFLYINAGATPGLSAAGVKAAKKAGFNVKYTAGIDVTEFNYVPYVQTLKDKGIKYVGFVATTQQAVRMKQAMAQQQYKPEIFAVTEAQYGPDYPQQVGSDGEGSYLSLPHEPFETAKSAEVGLYQTWLDQVSPGTAPTTAGVFGWSAARFFVENAAKLGAKLTRETFVKSVQQEHAWTANGMHVPMDVGGKNTHKCTVIVKLVGSVWKQESPGKYICGGTVDVR